MIWALDLLIMMLAGIAQWVGSLGSALHISVT